MSTKNSDLTYEVVARAILTKVFEQAPSEMEDLLKSGFYFEGILPDKIQIRIQGVLLDIELIQYTQGFKAGSFSVQYRVVREGQVLWVGNVFVDPEEAIKVEGSSYDDYRETRLMDALGSLDVLLQATLESDLTEQDVEAYLKYQIEQRGPAAFPHLTMLTSDFTFLEFKGHRLSEVFAIEIEGVLLYGFLQELGTSRVTREGREDHWQVYEFYTGLRRGVVYPVGDLPGIKGVFHQSRSLGACWLRNEEQPPLLDQLIHAFERIEGLEECCFPGLYEDEDYQLQVIRQGVKVEVSCLTDHLDYSRETIEGVLALVAELQDLKHGAIRLDEAAWDSVLEIIENMDLWFILDYHGFQPFCACYVESLLEKMEELASNPVRMHQYLMNPNVTALHRKDEDSCISHHYELTPSLKFEPLTVGRAVEVIDAMVMFLTDFYKIEYTDLSYVDKTML